MNYLPSSILHSVEGLKESQCLNYLQTENHISISAVLRLFIDV